MLRTAILSAFTKQSGLTELFNELKAMSTGDTPTSKANVKANMREHMGRLRDLVASKR